MSLALEERILFLLKNAQFFTLATRALDDSVWASTLSYVVKFSPLRIIWCSEMEAKHSINIRSHNQTSGSIYCTNLQDTSPIGMDGAQFTGLSREIPASEAEDVYYYFSKQKFQDDAIREQWMPPLSDFLEPRTRSFYELEISEIWLLDIDNWKETKRDRRISVNTNVGE